MQPPFPSPTPTWHNDTYSTISPSRPELSAAGKTVVVIGAGSGIGQETALAFAQAGAAKVVVVGRTESSLTSTQALLAKTTASVQLLSADITSEDAMQKVAKAVKQWDVLIVSAAFFSSPRLIADSSVGDWWQAFETNVKGPMLAVQAFIPSANPTHVSILGVTTGGVFVPPTMVPNMSSYISSKLAMVKILEYVAAENPNLFVASLHPGTVDTAMYTKSGRHPMPMDAVQLPAHFMVWMVSPEAKFLRGRTVWANWDVNELKAKASEIESGIMLTSGIYGWPFP